MEKFYIVTNEKYLTDKQNFDKLCEVQRDFINGFFEEHNIHGASYYMGGDGFVNCAFDERSKKSIRLYIEPSAENKHEFSKQLLSKLHRTGLIGFRKNSKLLQDFQQQCVEKHIPINLWRPRIGDYIDKLLMGGYRHQQFECDGKVYLMVESNKLSEDEQFEGFVEIKGSEYHTALEKVLENEKESR